MYKVYIIIIYTLIAFEVCGQGHLVRGNIKDDSNSTVPGATVVEIDANNRVVIGTLTDMNGNYVLMVSSENSRIQYSFIGYKTVVENVNGRSTIDMKFASGTELLQDVVITAVGKSTSVSGISDKFRAGSVGELKMSSLEGVVVNDVGDALQGQIAGLDIVSNSSPGKSANIVIRGLSTIGNATPLIVIDGIAQQSYSNFNFASADVEDLSALLSVPTQDIKSIRVLKDATECAIWGSSGANGVIEIETNRGKKGKTKFTYTYKHTLDELHAQIPMLTGDEYIMMQQEQLFNRYGLTDIPDEIAYNPNYIDFNNYNKNTNWYKEISKNGFIKEHGFKVDGGGDNTSYYVSLNLYDQEGQVINESLNKLSSLVNLSYNISKNIRLTCKFTYLNSKTGSNYFNVTNMAYMKAPNMAVYQHDANDNLTGEYFNPITNYQGNGISYFNPVAVVNNSKNDISTNQLSSDFMLNLRLSQYVSLNEVVSIFNNGSKNNAYLPYNAIGAAWNNGQNNFAREINGVNSTLTTRSTLVFKPETRSGHTLETSLMYETVQSNSKSMVTATQLNMSTSIQDPGASSIVNSISSNDSKTTSLGLLGSVGYNYQEKYFLTTYYRADASSRFGMNNRWGFFPSIGAKWRMKNEAFLKNINFLNNSNLSLSWGRSGNQGSIGPYSRHGIYTDGGQYMNDVSIIPSQPALDNLKWETKEEYSSSLDLGLFESDKLSLLIEYYNKKTFNLAWPNYSIPSSTGYNKLGSFNGGIIRNVGFDFTATVRDLVKMKDFSLLLNFNVNKNRNWFDEVPDNQTLESNGVFLENLKYPLKMQLGSPIGSFFGVRYLGVYATDEDARAKNADGSNKVDSNGKPVYMVFNNSSINRFRGGDAIYEDINHDGSIDINDAVFLGDSNPKLTGGFGTTANYKQFQLSAQFVFRYKFNVINQVAMNAESMNNRNNQSKATLSRWRREGDSFEGIIPRAYEGHTFNSLGSNRYVEDVSYIKFNSLALTYRMGKNMKTQLGINDCSLSLNVRKLYTWTGYGGVDPEINTKMQDPFWVARDQGNTTPPRSYSLSIAITL